MNRAERRYEAYRVRRQWTAYYQWLRSRQRYTWLTLNLINTLMLGVTLVFVLSW